MTELIEFTKIDRGLKIYYERLDRHDYENDDGIGKFLEYCIDNELEEDDIDDELSLDDPCDCVYVNFDTDFPFETAIDDEEEKSKIIFEIIKQCYNNGQPNIKPKKLSIIQNKNCDWTLQLTADEYKNYKDMYAKQCPLMTSLKNSIKDETFWYGLCIGIKNNFPFLQYLSCIYMRNCIENMLLNEIESADKDDADVSQWIKTHNDYFINMNNSNQRITIPIIDHDDESKQQPTSKSPTISEFIQAAIISYLYRISPPLILPTPLGLIKDEIQDMADCITAISCFLKPNFFDLSKCPFQFDFVIALNEIAQSDDLDDSDSDEKDTDAKSDLVDWVGDFSDNLKANNCVYYVQPPSELRYTSKRINSAFVGFIELLKEKYKSCDPKYMANYPQKRRFIGFLDKRETICQLSGKNNNIEPIQNENLNSLTFFEPTSDVREFPNYKQYQKMITVPEWHLESTQKCLIPCNEYPEQPSISPNDDGYNLLKTKNALTACDGKLLTFSFHVLAETEVRCYMWWRGTCLLFLPQDITDLLPKLFENEDDFLFEGYDVCSWRDEKFERIYQNVTMNDPTECLRKYHQDDTDACQ